MITLLWNIIISSEGDLTGCLLRLLLSLWFELLLSAILWYDKVSVLLKQKVTYSTTLCFSFLSRSWGIRTQDSWSPLDSRRRCITPSRRHYARVTEILSPFSHSFTWSRISTQATWMVRKVTFKAEIKESRSLEETWRRRASLCSWFDAIVMWPVM